jgi:hypothetical protein
MNARLLFRVGCALPPEYYAEEQTNASTDGSRRKCRTRVLTVRSLTYWNISPRPNSRIPILTCDWSTRSQGARKLPIWLQIKTPQIRRSEAAPNQFQTVLGNSLIKRSAWWRKRFRLAFCFANGASVSFPQCANGSAGKIGSYSITDSASVWSRRSSNSFQKSLACVPNSRL